VKAQNEKRILVVGDAFSMPEGLDYTNSYPYLLEQQLRKKFTNLQINVINAGVTGYSPNEECAQLKKYINVIKPDIVINEFFVNEFDDINVSKGARQTNIGFFVDRSLLKQVFGNDRTPLQLNRFVQRKWGKKTEYTNIIGAYYSTMKRTPIIMMIP